MKFRIVRPTTWNKRTKTMNKHIYPLIGGTAAHKLALTESIKYPDAKIYMKNAKTGVLMYIYNRGNKKGFTTYFWRK